MAKLLLLRPDRGIVESSGAVSRWEDQSGNGNDMRNGTSAEQPQYSGGAVVFDGVDDWLFHYDVVDTSFGNFGTSDFTISVRMQHHPLNTYDQFLSKGSQGASNYVFGFWLDGAKVNFGTNSTYLTDSSNVVAGQYYLVTIVRSGDVAYLYVDSNLVATNSTYFSGQNLTNSYRFGLGCRSSVPDHNFSGTISDVRVDDVALSQSQIRSYFNWINNGRKDRGFAKISRILGF